MKVTGYTPTDQPGSRPQAVATPKPDANAVQTATSAASSAGVSVVITTNSRPLGKAGQSAPAEVNTAKVAAVKAAIQNGSYVVNHQAIADKLLANTQDMFGSSPT